MPNNEFKVNDSVLPTIPITDHSATQATGQDSKQSNSPTKINADGSPLGNLSAIDQKRKLSISGSFNESSLAPQRKKPIILWKDKKVVESNDLEVEGKDLEIKSSRDIGVQKLRDSFLVAASEEQKQRFLAATSEEQKSMFEALSPSSQPLSERHKQLQELTGQNSVHQMGILYHDHSLRSHVGANNGDYQECRQSWLCALINKDSTNLQQVLTKSSEHLEKLEDKELANALIETKEYYQGILLVKNTALEGAQDKFDKVNEKRSKTILQFLSNPKTQLAAPLKLAIDQLPRVPTQSLSLPLLKNISTAALEGSIRMPESIRNQALDAIREPLKQIPEAQRSEVLINIIDKATQKGTLSTGTSEKSLELVDDVLESMENSEEIDKVQEVIDAKIQQTRTS